MSEADAIRDVRDGDGPFTVRTLAGDLTALGLTHGETVLVHTSLRRLGWIAGGAQALLDALEAVLGPEGTLVMPTFSGGLSDPAHWVAPPVPEAWWPVIRAEMPAFDPARTPTREMGATAECFRSLPGTLRSPHPNVSFAARGPRAQELVGEHPLEAHLGEGSPLAKLYELDGRVLLLGVDHGNNSSLHLAEYRSDYAGKREVENGAPMRVDGERRWVSYTDVDLSDRDFARLGEEFEQDEGAVRRGPVGAGEGRLMSQRALVDYAVAWLPAHRSEEGPADVG